jgi:hypothetical protein
MKSNIIAASILGICLVVAAFIFSGRYYFVRLEQCTVARGDRWTGKVEAVALEACKWNF